MNCAPFDLRTEERRSLCLCSRECGYSLLYTIQYSVTFVGVDLDLSVSQGMVVPCNIIVGIAMVFVF